MRAGNDKSHMARQVERYADIYMSRVSNFLFQTPFVFLRSPRGSLPHDPEPGPGAEEEEGGLGERPAHDGLHQLAALQRGLRIHLIDQRDLVQ